MPRKTSDKQRRSTVSSVKLKPQTSCKDLQHDLAAERLSVHYPQCKMHYSQGDSRNLIEVEGHLDSGQILVMFTNQSQVMI